MFRYVTAAVDALRRKPEEGRARYRILRRNLMLIMLVVSLFPLTLVAVISHLESERAIQAEALAPLETLVNKTKHSFELFLAERKSAISFIASAYDFEKLADQHELERIFHIMTSEFGGFVDLGLIDTSGVQVSYVGPYKLQGKKYADHEWFQEVMVTGEHISSVFLGYRSLPHFVIAVKHIARPGHSWTLRATIDTDMFDALISSIGLDPGSDAFILDREGVLQTNSRFYGDLLTDIPFDFPLPRSEAESVVVKDDHDNEVLLVTASVPDTPFVLMMTKPKTIALKAWNNLKTTMFTVYTASVALIVIMVYAIATQLVQRIEVSDLKREAALHSVEHANKLASIGRLAAGVAHEINNPLAIINEKAGLMEDLVGAISSEMPYKERFLQLTRSIIQSVDRCSTITHRLLGFARRMDVKVEKVQINEVMQEVVGFLEREAFHRNIELLLELDENLPQTESDHGQLQQVFLNIVNNAFQAVDDGGAVRITTFQPDPKTIAASIQDNGCGMSTETCERIFEPFYSTKGAKGTGLGLSITYGIVQKLGGEIEIDSEEGVGSTFTIKLPVHNP